MSRIRNLSNNQAYQRSFQYNSTMLSAEWIVERPTINRVQYPLANFGNLTFTDCSATVEGRTGGITGFPHSIVYLRGRMANDLVDISNVSAGRRSLYNQLRLAAMRPGFSPLHHNAYIFSVVVLTQC